MNKHDHLISNYEAAQKALLEHIGYPYDATNIQIMTKFFWQVAGGSDIYYTEKKENLEGDRDESYVSELVNGKKVYRGEQFAGAYLDDGTGDGDYMGIFEISKEIPDEDE
jgi:hypothetical protein